ncbi:FUSC family protein [Streptomyces piniterrae]|uniref:FUSC family protein n=1 Tax=Streptomyces piniterrae TaxID=2571125 RepID=A0A4V6WHR8_9ACTN|nr:FUSC family protein [Streptomyces piniterrae]TJZ56868.1 FUSC family protein [Streptomyces piniterrae]
MGKHARPAGKRATTATATATAAVPKTGARIRPLPVRPLPLRSTVRLGRPVDIWHKPALSAVTALAVPDVTLLVIGRLDLILYTSAGAMCALYAHGLPYAARARTLSRVVLGMVASLGIALTAASLTSSAALLVVFASLLAAVHKVVCDATRIGPPGNLIFTFITASAFFVPQRLGQVPGHLALALGTGMLAWLVCMAPALVRPQGPQRIATARALEAAAGLLRTGRITGHAEEGGEGGVAHARHATAAAVNAAWHTLFLVPARAPAKAAARAGLERLLVRAESTLGGVTGDGASAEAERLDTWARGLRRGGPLPDVALSAAQADELAGIAAERPDRADEAKWPRQASWLRRPTPGRPHGLRAVLARLAPGSPLLPIGARVAAGCVLAGWASMAVGVGHPYWAVVTAASIYQANTTLSWQRALQRTLGNLLGLLLFTALLPLIHTGHLAMIALALACQLGAEAWITRNYWLGSVCVTPMALLLTSFGGRVPVRALIADRWIDTVVGAAVGLACCVLVTNRRASDRIDIALERVAEAMDAATAACRLLAADPGPDSVEAQRISQAKEVGPVPQTSPAKEAGRARDRLAGCLVELREAVEVAAGEWWQRDLPAERIAHAEREGHLALAGLVRRLSAPTLAA